MHGHLLVGLLGRAVGDWMRVCPGLPFWYDNGPRIDRREHFPIPVSMMVMKSSISILTIADLAAARFGSPPNGLNKSALAAGPHPSDLVLAASRFLGISGNWSLVLGCEYCRSVTMGFLWLVFILPRDGGEFLAFRTS
ncbi:hypothetical protein B0J13DRAFT_330504 [Dactylonectria estremocensis]|uniref:Uncharacterized protein n=1 Tax=Dactylonectria estremocensis TaxID=1079267 RepID=A0A9P9J788_9HYPO|nr:hypothetical protein B0J13DRAFT_330504 [Dactylonectria estremocensis]